MSNVPHGPRSQPEPPGQEFPPSRPQPQPYTYGPPQQPSEPYAKPRSAEERRWRPGAVFGWGAMVLVGLVLIVVGGGMLFGILTDLPPMQQVEGTLTVDVPEDQAMTLWSRNDAIVRCQVTDPDGARVLLRTDTSSSSQRGGVSYESLGEFAGDGAPAGTWSVTCDRSGASVSESLDLVPLFIAIFLLPVGIVSVIIGGLLMAKASGKKVRISRSW
ncbi:hypothetical protein [uncultured Tessaracoccus sp.]|uniref:hypothetical protein n=1 Tax=uncultured Tessaracoccus sp. TaxID=905023 RepID=UPI0025EFC903|nr:hypothetical protein [uncultured Tessaracoccus sp.]